MPEKTLIDDETISRFLARSAAYFARDPIAMPAGVRVDRRRSRAEAVWPRARERRSHVGNPRQYPSASSLA